MPITQVRKVQVQGLPQLSDEVAQARGNQPTLKDYIDTKIPLSEKGAPGGVATLGDNRKIVPDQLPLEAGPGISIQTDEQQGTVIISNTAPPPPAFANIAVQGQPTVSADQGADTFTLIAGDGIQITTDPQNSTITITNISLGAPAFGFIKVGSTTIVADNPGDTLELVAGSYIQITPDADNDKITISVTGVAPASHTHAITDITNLQTELNNRVKKTGDDINGKLNLNTSNGRLVIPVGSNKYAT